MKNVKNIFEKCNLFLNKHKKVFLVIFVILILARLWLFLTMNWSIEMDSYYDSRLEMNSAVSMGASEWGGDYSKFILCKGLAYPIFLTVLFFARIPYPVGLFLLVVLSAFLFARSLKPVVKNDWLRKLIFLFILFNPVGMGGEMAYPYRNALMPMVVLIIMSAILAVYLRRGARIKKLLPWGLVGLIFTGFFWNLREDSIWFLPFILVAALITILHFFIEHKKDKQISWKKKAAVCFIALMPLVSIFIWNTGISVANNNTYGIYTTQDRTKTYSAKALGALIRIDDGADLESDYWVSDEALKLAKEVSPTLAGLNLKPFDDWSKVADYSIWAFRDSMAASGYYKDAKETDEVYKKIYDELEEGFKSGKLKRKNGVQLSDTSGLYSSNEMLKPIGTAFKSLITHAFYNEYKVELQQLKNARNESDIILYEDQLGVNLLRSDEYLDKINANERARRVNENLKGILRKNKKITNGMVLIYNIISPILLVVATIGIIARLVTMFMRKQFGDYNVELLVFVLGIVATILFYSYTVGLWGLGFDLTADSDLFKSYTTPQTIMVSCIEVIGIICLVKTLQKGCDKKKIRRKKK